MRFGRTRSRHSDDGRRVARVPGDERPHVWMVNTGGFPGTPETGMRRGSCVRQSGDTRSGDTRPSSLVVPFVGAGLGGKALDKGGLLPRLLETLAEEAQRLDMDIAFVTRDRRAFGAAQAFRRRDPVDTGRR